MKTALLLFICCSLTVSQGFCQIGKARTLSKQQMYADYDTLVNTLKQISPQYAFRKKLTGVDVYKLYQNYRQKIPSIYTVRSFYELVRKTLMINQDDHTSFVWPSYTTPEGFSKLGISSAAVNSRFFYDSLFFIPARQNHLNFSFKYLNGKYYNIIPFIYKGKRYNAGWQLLYCNNLPIDQFVAQLYPYLQMRWDANQKKYYSDRFFKAKNFKDADHIKITFGRPHASKLTGNFLIADSVSLVNIPFKKNKQKQVSYFTKSKILYIRVPEMNVDDTAWYPAEILKRALNNEINKIVIDIRDNGGGDDAVWRNILSSIIPEQIIFKECLITNKSAKIKQILGRQFDTTKQVSVPFLSRKLYWVYYRGYDTIPSYKNTLRFKGRVYILQNQNIFSSAGSLAAVANQVRNYYTIGQSTGAQLGIGITPLIFELPNSKIIYRIEPVIDYTGVFEPSDILHDKVRLPIKLKVSDYIQRLNSADLYSEFFLTNYDAVFKSIITMNK